MGVGEDIQAAHKTTQVERRLTAIASASAERRITLVRQLHIHFVPRLVPKFLPRVTKLLSDDNPAVRHQVVLLLLHLFDLHPKGFAKAVGPLANLVQDARADNRTTALELLDKVTRQEPKAVLPQLAKLVEQLDNPLPGVQAPLLQLITDLGRRAPTAVVAQLAKLLDSKKKATVQNALALLEQVAERQPSAVARATPQLVKLLGNRDANIRERASQMLILASAAGVEAVPRLLLRPLLARKVDPDLKLHAILTVQQLAERQPKQFAPAVRHLARDLGHQRWEIREQATLLLGVIGRNNIGLVKEAVPSLAHALKDGDEVVRTAAVKVMEELGVSSFDYDAIQNASAVLESARGVIHSAQKFDVATGQADKLLADAEKAYARGDYPKCIDYSARAEDMAARAEKESDKVKAVLTRAESTIQSVSHKGVSVAASEAVLAEGKKLLEKQRYKEARQKAEEAVLLSQQQAVDSRPDLVLQGRLEGALAPDDWSSLPLELEADATVVPKAQRAVVTRRFHVDCGNCGARMPSDFRICGKCGLRLRERVERKVGYHCLGCNSPLSLNQKFCGSCGSASPEKPEAPTSCQQCSGALSPGQHFCGGCGAPVVIA